MEPVGITFPANIDPGEAILAVIGVRPLLTKEIERIRAPQWREIATLDRTVHRMAQDLVRGGLERSAAYPQIDYESTLKAFSKPPEPDQVMAMLDDIPSEADMPFLSSAARAYNFLRGEYPICVERTVFGANQLEPGPFALGIFEDMLELIDRPLSVFGAIESGRLTTEQAAALQAVYPTLYPEIAIEVAGACMSYKADHTNWDPDFGRGVSILLGIPGIDPNLRAQLATTKPTEPEKPAAPQGNPPKSKRARLIATRSDRLEIDE